MRNLIPSWARVLIAFFVIFAIVEYFMSTGDKPAFIEQPIIMAFMLLVLLILIAIEGIVGSLENVLYQSLDEDGKARYDAKKAQTPAFITWLGNVYKKLVGSRPIQEEHEIILDHNYDGIKELDNSLPPWWLYGFYASIIFGAIYLLRYHVFNGPTQFDELETQYAEANLAIEAYKKTAKDLVDFNTVELLTSPSDLSNGKKIFEVNCVACHKADGGGGIGPNLTDRNWILGGGIKNVFKTISEGGRDGKGMIAWKSSLKPSEMAQVASYLLQFEGTTPAEPKAPEGEIWVDPDAEAPAETNEVVADSLKTE